MKIDEIKKHKSELESSKSREIVKKIIDFGVSDFQIKKIIKFLSLELENRDLMINISNIIDKNIVDSDNSDTNQQKIKIEV